MSGCSFGEAVTPCVFGLLADLAEVVLPVLDRRAGAARSAAGR